MQSWSLTGGGHSCKDSSLHLMRDERIHTQSIKTTDRAVRNNVAYFAQKVLLTFSTFQPIEYSFFFAGYGWAANPPRQLHLWRSNSPSETKSFFHHIVSLVMNQANPLQRLQNRYLSHPCFSQPVPQSHTELIIVAPRRQTGQSPVTRSVSKYTDFCHMNSYPRCYSYKFFLYHFFATIQSILSFGVVSSGFRFFQRKKVQRMVLLPTNNNET